MAKLRKCERCSRTVSPLRSSRAGWWCPSCSHVNPPASHQEPILCGLTRREVVLQTIGGISSGLAGAIAIRALDRFWPTALPIVGTGSLTAPPSTIHAYGIVSTLAFGTPTLTVQKISRSQSPPPSRNLPLNVRMQAWRNLRHPNQIKRIAHYERWTAKQFPKRQFLQVA
jgi:hypothetical protein